MIYCNKTNTYTDKVIIDNEISNQISDPDPRKDWHYDKAKLTVVGVLYQDNLYQAVLTDTEDNFKAEIKHLLATLPQPFYAFNKFMEQGNFLGYLQEHYEVEEIKPFMAKGFSKAKFYQILVDMQLEPPLPDPFNDNSALAITEWAKGNKQAVMEHNKNCLLKEHAILKHRQALIDKYKDRINHSGWLE